MDGNCTDSTKPIGTDIFGTSQGRHVSEALHVAYNNIDASQIECELEVPFMHAMAGAFIEFARHSQ